jgi:hypothetical protein
MYNNNFQNPVPFNQCSSSLAESLSLFNSSNLVEPFRVRVGTGIESLRLVLPPKNLDRWNRADLKTQYFNLTTWAPIKYLSSDHIVTWSIRRLCKISRCFTHGVQICDPTNIYLVKIKTRQLRLKHGVFSKRLNDYWSDPQSECGRWKSR